MKDGEREDSLFLAFSVLNNAEEIRRFLLELLSPTELENITKRWCVTRRLFDGHVQTKARTQCGTSKAVVTRVNRAVIRDGNGMSREVHRRLKGMNAADE